MKSTTAAASTLRQLGNFEFVIGDQDTLEAPALQYHGLRPIFMDDYVHFVVFAEPRRSMAMVVRVWGEGEDGRYRGRVVEVYTGVQSLREANEDAIKRAREL